MVSRISFCSHLRNLCSLRNDIIGPLQVQTDASKLQTQARTATIKPSRPSLSLLLAFFLFFLPSFLRVLKRSQRKVTEMSFLALRYLSVCPYGRFRQPSQGISWYLMLGGLTDICRYVAFLVNTLRTGEAYLRFYITTVQDGWRKSAFLTRAFFPTQYT